MGSLRFPISGHIDKNQGSRREPSIVLRRDAQDKMRSQLLLFFTRTFNYLLLPFSCMLRPRAAVRGALERRRFKAQPRACGRLAPANSAARDESGSAASPSSSPLSALVLSERAQVRACVRA